MRGRDAGLLGDDACRQLLARHFEREETDDAAIHRLHRAVGLQLAAISLRNVVGDVGRERGLAHGRAAGEDDQIRRLQSAHLLVEVVEAGRDAGKMPVALVGGARHVDGGLERFLERMEAAVIFAGLGQREQSPLGVLDLRAGRHVDRRVIGDVDDILADADQRAAQRQVVDGAAIILRIDDRRRLGGEAR